MAIDDDTLNSWIGSSRHWYSITRIIRGVIIAITLYTFYLGMEGMIGTAGGVVLSFFTSNVSKLNEGRHVMVNGMIIIFHRLESMLAWIGVNVVDLIGYQSGYFTALVLLVVIPGICYCVVEFSQDSVRAATRQNNDD